ncbi:hypothetical protein I3843_04G110600 [Carya illinoinensis]|nr:hypothetical protein I3843_04G110600 [Carya illinoinensis]
MNQFASSLVWYTWVEGVIVESHPSGLICTCTVRCFGLLGHPFSLDNVRRLPQTTHPIILAAICCTEFGNRLRRTPPINRREFSCRKIILTKVRDQGQWERRKKEGREGKLRI